MTTDPELERLLIAYAGAAYHFSEDEIDKARDAVLAHIAAQYVRRPPELSLHVPQIGDEIDNIDLGIVQRWDGQEWIPASTVRPPVPPLLPTPADVDAGKCRWTEHGWEWTDYRAARGILPWKSGDPAPEEAIRRLRDGDRQHTLHLDDAGDVAGGVGDFEGER